MSVREWCWLRALYRWARTGFGTWVAGHDYVHQETHSNCTVTVSRCSCGTTSVAWHHGDPNEVELSPSETCNCLGAALVAAPTPEAGEE